MRQKHRLVRIVLFFYLAVLFYLMFIGFSRSPSELYMYNLKPFSTIKNYFVYFDHYNLSTWVINIVGNIGVFVPVGLLLPLYDKGLQNFFRFIFVFGAGITTLEALQLSFRVGSFDVDDIILNTLGASIGYMLWKLISLTKLIRFFSNH